MTTQSLNWAKSVLDTLFYKVAEPITGNLHNTEQICRMLADEPSRAAYVQELAYKALFLTLGLGQRAGQFTGGMPFEKFRQDCQRAAQDTSLPSIHVEGDPGMLYHSYTCTFYYRQYEYSRIDEGRPIGPRKGDVMLDCGACYGDTAAWAAQYDVKQIFSFEIAPANLKIMERTFRDNSMTDIAEAVPMALGAEPGTLWFTPDPRNDAAGTVGTQQKNNSIAIPVTTVDAFCSERGITPDFIKMDIEGSEYDALRGAEQTIRRCKPRLAICLYHHLQDMWRIPLLLKQFAPDYRFYCKKSHPFVKFVLFAESEERERERERERLAAVPYADTGPRIAGYAALVIFTGISCGPRKDCRKERPCGSVVSASTTGKDAGREKIPPRRRALTPFPP